MKTLTISLDTEQAARRRRYQSKGRCFRALKLAHVTCDALWEGSGNGDTIRPVYIQLAGLETELRPVVANLRGGRKAEIEGEGSRSNPPKLELMKSAGYSWSWQRGLDEQGACAVTAWIDGLCTMDPGMVDPAGCSFLCLTPRWWAERETARTQQDEPLAGAILAHWDKLQMIAEVSKRVFPPTFNFKPAEEVLALVPQAARFAAYLDRRTRRPLVTRPEFFLQLYLAALSRGVASLSSPADRYSYSRNEGPLAWAQHVPTFVEVDTAEVGLLPGVACDVKHAELETFLAEQVALFFKLQEKASV